MAGQVKGEEAWPEWPQNAVNLFRGRKTLLECVDPGIKQPLWDASTCKKELASIADKIESSDCFWQEMFPEHRQDKLNDLRDELIELERVLRLQSTTPGFQELGVAGMCRKILELVLKRIAVLQGLYSSVSIDAVTSLKKLINDTKVFGKLEKWWCHNIRYLGKNKVHDQYNVRNYPNWAKLKKPTAGPSVCCVATTLLVNFLEVFASSEYFHNNAKPKVLAELAKTKHRLVEERQRQRGDNAQEQDQEQAAKLKENSHALIKQHDLGKLWEKHFRSQEQVEWKQWWRNFPSGMRDIMEIDSYTQVVAMLGDDKRLERVGFQAAMKPLGQDHNQPLLVTDLNAKFPKGSSLAECIQQLLDNACLVPTPDAEWPDVREEDLQAAVEKLSVKTSNTCDLPWRTEKPNKVAVKVLVLKGESGVGKTTLSKSVAWELYQANQLTGGARFVQLRGADTLARQCKHFCAAFGLRCDHTKVEVAWYQLLHKLGKTYSDKCMLLVLDNAEDALSGDEKNVHRFLQMLNEITNTLPHARLLLSSRVPWPVSSRPEGYAEHNVSALDADCVAKNLRNNIGEDMASDEELRELIHLADGCLMALQVIKTAIGAAGSKLTAEETLEKLKQEDVSKGMIEICIYYSYTSKERSDYLAPLSLFPTGFSEEDAVQLLECSRIEATEWIGKWYTQRLLQRDCNTGRYCFHALVKKAIEKLSKKSIDSKGRQCFIILMLDRFEHWAKKYNSKDYMAALVDASNQAENIQHLWKLLKHPKANEHLPRAINAAFSCHELLTNIGVFEDSTDLWEYWRQQQLENKLFEQQTIIDILNLLAYCSPTDEVLADLTTHLKQAGATTTQRLLRSTMCFISSGRYADTGQVVDRYYKPNVTSVWLPRNQTLHIDVGGDLPAMIAEFLAHRQRSLAWVEWLQGAADQLLSPQDEDIFADVTTIKQYAVFLKATDDLPPRSVASWFANARRIIEDRLGDDHPTTISLVLMESCNPDRALLHRASRQYKDMLGPAPVKVYHLQKLTSLCIQDGQYQKAYKASCAALTLSNERGDTMNIIRSYYDKAEASKGLGKHDEAEECHRKACEHIRSADKKDRTHLFCFQAYAEFLVDHGKHDEAEELYKEAIRLFDPVLPVGPLEYHMIPLMQQLAELLLRKGDYASAMACFEETTATIDQHIWGGDSSKLTSLCGWIAAWEKSGKHQDAEKHIREALYLSLDEDGPMCNRVQRCGDSCDCSEQLLKKLCRCLEAKGKDVENDELVQRYEEAKRDWMESQQPYSSSELSDGVDASPGDSSRDVACSSSNDEVTDGNDTNATDAQDAGRSSSAQSEQAAANISKNKNKVKGKGKGGNKIKNKKYR